MEIWTGSEGRDVALMIITEQLPFKFVESKGFRNVMRNAQPL